MSSSASKDRIFLWSGTIVMSWIGMQVIHELGHVFATWSTGGRVQAVALDPLRFSRTDLAHNPQPLVVAWAGAGFGALFPTSVWLVWRQAHRALLPILRFFAGFCLIANGSYLAVGSVMSVGDAADLLHHGVAVWQLRLFGIVTTPL